MIPMLRILHKAKTAFNVALFSSDVFGTNNSHLLSIAHKMNNRVFSCHLTDRIHVLIPKYDSTEMVNFLLSGSTQ